jgi:hypothetical protein
MAMALVEGADFQVDPDLAVANTLTTVDENGLGVVRVMNTGSSVIQVAHNCPVGRTVAPAYVHTPTPLLAAKTAEWVTDPLEEVSVESIIHAVEADWGSSAEEDSAVSEDEILAKEWGGPVPPHLMRLFKEGSQHLTVGEQRTLAAILRRYRNTFVRSNAEMGLTHVAENKFDTGDAAPVKDRPRRIPLHKRPLVEKYVKEMIDAGVIQPSESPWAACPVLVGKPDGSTRWCVDWRGLNAVTV